MNLDVTWTWVLLGFTAFACARFCWVAWDRYADPFHPAFFLGAACFAAYVLQPTMLLYLQPAETLRYLRPAQLEFVALINFLGVALMLAAAVRRPALAGSRSAAPGTGPAVARGPAPLRAPAARDYNRRRLRWAAHLLGFVGLASFVYGIVNVGGFDEAYGRSYGGGGSAIGYVRDAYWLCLPAVALLLIADGVRPANIPSACLFAAPLFIHGLLGGRRGPTASVLICLAVAYGLSRRWRPALWQFAVLLAGMGLLLLAIVANRSAMYWGSQAGRLDRGIESYATKAGSSNEFIYGGGVIVAANKAGQFYWGGRYATVLLIRPIPRALWPEKYAFAEEFLGVPNLEKAGANFGTGGDFLSRNIGWRVPQGAAPCLIADLWLEFSWGALAALWLIGWSYNQAWSRAVSGDVFWGVAYTLMAAFSVYLIAQTLEAMLFRFALTAGATVVAWFYAVGRLPHLKVWQRDAGRRAGARG